MFFAFSTVTFALIEERRGIEVHYDYQHISDGFGNVRVLKVQGFVKNKTTQDASRIDIQFKLIWQKRDTIKKKLKFKNVIAGSSRDFDFEINLKSQPDVLRKLSVKILKIKYSIARKPSPLSAHNIVSRKSISLQGLMKEGSVFSSIVKNLKTKHPFEEPPKDEFEFEKMVIEKCIVEDVGGFLYAPRAGGQVKRTSNFYTGYMIPAVETLKGAIIEPQLHTRYALGTPFVEKQEKQAGQMIYYVELASALYTFSFDIDTKYIGKITFKIDRVGDSVIDEEEMVARKKTMFEAFSRFMTEMMFGAKRTRFLPVVDWESAVIAVSDDIWTVPSPATRQYIQKSKEKLELINYNTSLFIYDSKEGGTLEKTLFEAIEDTLKSVTIQNLIDLCQSKDSTKSEGSEVEESRSKHRR